MRILAVETSTMLGGVAVMEADAGLVVELRLNVRAEHSERLLAETDRALRMAGLKMADIDVLAAAAGPGSFTGLRIGLGTVKGLSFATGSPVVAVPTLEALAWNLPHSEGPICPVLDARKKEVYAGLFLREADGLKRLVGERALKPAELVASVRDYESVIFTGQGAFLIRGILEEALGGRALFAPAHLAVPMPSSVAHLGLLKAGRGEFSDPSTLRPLYMRKSEAELKRLG